METAPEGPVAKRQRLSAPSSWNGHGPGPGKSRLFAPFRTVGLVSPTEVPFSTLPLGKTTFQITTSAGRCLQTYDLRRGLNLVFITRPQTPEVITALTAWKDRVVAAWGGEQSGGSQGIWVFKRGKKTSELELPQGPNEAVRQLLVFGAWIVACCATRIEVWKSATLEHYTTLASPFAGPQGSNALSGGICNMPTYLNKIVAGRTDGSVEIWNVSTGKLIYTILPAGPDYGAVTTLEPAPALSLLAIAYGNGPVVIRNIRTDKEVLSFNTGTAQKHAVTSMSFRTDGMGAGQDGSRPGVMATAARGTGDVVFWDLNKGGRKMGVLRGAHNPPSSSGGIVAGGITKVEFLAGQPVIITSGLDNALKSWIFDESPFSPVPRILHARSGHAAPVTRLQFLPSEADGADSSGKWLMSASRDRSLWGWSLRRDGQSTELSQGNIRRKAKKMGILSSGLASMDAGMSLEDLKAPPITSIACSLNRDGGIGAMPGVNSTWTSTKGKKATETSAAGWESVVTGHEGDKFARTWFWGRKKAGRWMLETGDGAEVTAVAVSPCGTFAFVGSATGGIDMFNLQSGMHRQRFPARLTPAQAKRMKLQQAGELENGSTGAPSKGFQRGQGKHTKAVTGIAVDSLNRTVISSGADGKLKFWEFATALLLHEMDWYPMTAITALRYHRPSDLIALSCDDGSIRIVDTETKKLVRELWGANGGTVDYTFSNDGRWIVSASSDSVIRVWDLPTGHLIDAIKLHGPCTALAFSNTGEYLATAQADAVGVDIWTNRTLFTHVPTRHISEKEIAEVEGPTASGEGGEGLIDRALEGHHEAADEPDEASIPSVDQLSSAITTLSLVPKSRWQNLLHLDLIRARNKPKEPPKPPEKAPFFLPSVNGEHNPAANPTLSTLLLDPDGPSAASELSRISKFSDITSDKFTTLLLDGVESGDAEPFIEHLKSLPPSAADLAIRGLNPVAPYVELEAFIKTLTERLRSRKDYELVQAWMAVFLRLHGEVVVEHEGLVQALCAWREEQRLEAGRLGKLVSFCSGVVGFLRSARS